MRESECVKMADFALLESSKLISRKIWEIEKFWNFQIVQLYWSSTVHTVEKREILSHQNFFRQINSLVTYLVKPFLSRIFCQKCMRENSRNFHRVCISSEIRPCFRVMRFFREMIYCLSFIMDFFDRQTFQNEVLWFMNYEIDLFKLFSTCM